MTNKQADLAKNVLLLLIFFACFACTKERVMEAPESSTIATVDALDAGLKYLALGDSYTIGQGVQESERFPAQTIKLLGQQGIRIQSPTYIATTGWTTANLMQAISSQNLLKNFDIVTLLICNSINWCKRSIPTPGYIRLSHSFCCFT
jgi:hypothetical protein